MLGVVVDVIIWLLDLHLPVQSVPITTKVVSSNPVHLRGVLDTTLCDKVCLWLSTGRWFSPGTPHQQNWQPRYNWNIVESGVKHHNSNPLILKPDYWCVMNDICNIAMYTYLTCWMSIEQYFSYFYDDKLLNNRYTRFRNDGGIGQPNQHEKYLDFGKN